MDIKVLKKDDTKVSFQISKINPSIANAIRRYILAYVPTMAIDEIEFKKNGSALYDEMLALRLGLTPLKTDLKSYKLWEGKEADRPHSAQYELKLTMNVEGPLTVYASDLESQDPKVVPAIEKTIITKLLEGQSIELIATARLGQGKEHAKYTPGLAIYRGVPQLTTTKDSNVTAVLEKLSEVIEKKGTGLEIKDLTRWNEAHEDFCEMNGIEVTSSKEDFIFTIESWGQLAPGEILKTAVEMFDAKIEEFETAIKKL
ncbi:DNA-directed RNA polymerase subunit D [Candidatus Woesearchaeota archaeon]|jgi:DNA-directed RNA polymerase subunit D|nr:DNA-directed RNA polymerase subunit D [Candidatus Woesearchaeota archaeon]MBT4058614.1 DNA-directed RNA polymerase subunit D [Candidatus Woesearchaeota archaeon]MBT4731750.1 DNA-directed RNA polymerase subunit D [Candidatus Woesearchaeota archaeon]MBT4783148.1 DNA-directed RNA polymerase subunit D [Candidatus Woesearchaeota archaeon]MBT5043334.1 DNA-directed RNA polymerase subunit D [Candidatus Woesearchaeota archaeon]